MKKMKRSARLVEITQQLLSAPHTIHPLVSFAERYHSAKSSISEDLSIIKEVFEMNGSGQIQTIAGAAGGVQYIPAISREAAMSFIHEICRQLEDPDRILPGGYLYLSDLLGEPMILNEIGRMFATAFADRSFDVVMTVETKGIPLAYATAACLNVPVVIVRRDHNVTEGSAVSINYVSGSSKRIQTMSLTRRALKEHSKVLIIDDFMKAGGTIQGMMNLLQEFNAEVAGVGVFVESQDQDDQDRLVDEHVSLAKLTGVDAKNKRISVEPGNYFDLLEE